MTVLHTGRDPASHWCVASLGHSHITHIVVPIHRNSLLPEPFFSLSRDSILVSTINTVTAYVILFDNRFQFLRR